MNQIVSHLYFLDLFRKPLYLRVKQQEKTATIFGILISLVIYGLLGFSFLKTDCFIKEKPKVITESFELPNNPPISYNRGIFSFGIQDIYKNSFHDANLFSFKVLQVTSNITENVNITVQEKGYHLCNITDVSTPSDFLRFKGLYCLDETKFTVFGQEGDPQSSSVQIHIVKCANSTENNNSCQSIDAIDNFLNMKNLIIVYVYSVTKIQK